METLPAILYISLQDCKLGGIQSVVILQKQGKKKNHNKKPKTKINKKIPSRGMGHYKIMFIDLIFSYRLKGKLLLVSLNARKTNL